MRKINVITQKELVDTELLRNCTAVVIDVLLATSTIVSLLENNYEPVYAVKDASTALELARRQEQALLLGEWNGEKIEGFEYPDPTLFLQVEEKTPAIICSTNGTIAIEKAKYAKCLYISSLVNGHRVAELIKQQEDESSIVLICSGNAGRFSIEDFVGAGHIVDHLTQKQDYLLSDSAKLAKGTFQVAKSTQFKDLHSSETACLLKSTGFQHTTNWVLEHFEAYNTVPFYKNGKLVSAT
ncbi:2-phosphosulfolactate phosphatase [Fredinandcohnia sp. 179-A 10B2 NHS]|uniref:2-phosphosulfolactate phosphatase n=1 Tax=Fredinandcohnia sp. 179-A 10B2 NHS TaxID=3235176 RepID=UPI0039A2A7AC